MTDFDTFTEADDLGPAKVVHITERRTGLRAIVVIDNVAAGPALGGTRMSTGMTTRVCARLARAMTLKNAMAGLAHGGAKSGIVADPKLPAADKERLIRAFAASIRDLTDYVPGPDMGTNEAAMALVLDEIGRAIGLPAALGGLPLDELGATGFGVAEGAEVAAGMLGVDLNGARVVVQGYGAVGRHAARFLEAKGAVLVAASDSRGAVIDPSGLDLDALDGIKGQGGSVAEYAGGAHTAERDEVITVECDLLIPAAGPDAIRADNVDDVKARLVLQGANIPATAEAEARLHQRGIVSVPDFVINAGGVICGAVEYGRGTRTQAFDAIADRVRGNVEEVLARSLETGETPRTVALELAHSRVRQAMQFRRWI
jgi:glutamate dehydrogenase (NAD(P)+)